MNAMHRIINSYQLPNATERDQAIEAILSNETDRKVVELWLKNNPVYTFESPMLSDLHHRITGAPAQTAADTTEEKILSGKLIDPQELLQHIDLIKAHVELKTLNVEDLLPLLLDHAATKDIANILSAAKRFTIPSTLSTTQLLRLGSINPHHLKPPFEQILNSDIKTIKELKDLNQAEKDAAIACHIEYKQLSLADVKEQLSDDEFLRLAPYLRYVDLNSFSNTELAQKFLKQCSNLNTLKIYNVKIIEGITELPFCKEFQSFCPTLKALPALPLCQVFLCDGNTVLTALPALPHCHTLNCYGCTALTALPALPLCKWIACDSCNFAALPALPLCEWLSCSACTALSALPALPRCQELDCSHCTSLTELPPLPLCKTLYCSECPLTELPELPWNAVVTTADEAGGLPFSALNIDLEKFSTDPVSLLLQLGDHLLNNKPFPNIYYFEKGQRNAVIDYGGVRRDFVTRLCLTLFNQLKMEDSFPIATSDNDEKAYRSLGCLLAQCYPEKSSYKTGPLFDPKVYQCIATPNPASDEWFLTNYLDLINAQNAPLNYLLDPTGETAYKDNQEELHEALLIRAKQHPQLKAISWMAQEMRKKVALAGNLQERVEGVLNPVALKRKLRWESPNSMTQEYLATWIDTHPEQLEKFVYAVTGNRTLCAENLKIQVFDRDKNFIPVAHTCYFSLELSGNYESQAVFDQKIDYFLENALAGSGFTMG